MKKLTFTVNGVKRTYAFCRCGTYQRIRQGIKLAAGVRS